MARYTFKKTERLTGKKNIEQLFHSNNFLRISPFKVYWQIAEKKPAESYSRLLISVPKKLHKTSVNRNLLKRRIRESYRTNKEPFVDFLVKNNITVHWGVIYLTAEILPFQTIEKKMILILQQLIQILESKNLSSEKGE